MTDRSERGGVVPMATNVVISPASRHSLGHAMTMSAAAVPSSGANPFAANSMLAFPFTLDVMTQIWNAWWVNGSAAGGNSSVAVYNADFTKIFETASTGGSGASVPQSVSTAPSSVPLKLAPGLYYCALAHDATTTNRFFRYTVATTGAGFWKMAGCWKQTSITVGALPDPATPVACTDVGFPLFGLATRSGFAL